MPIIAIPQLQKKISELAARFYDYPAKKMTMIGITGTNGKTSCSYFIAQALQSLGNTCGIVGTLGSGFFNVLQETGYTTPDAVMLQKILQTLCQQGAKSIAMEVTSQSLDQARVDGIDFNTAIFTNLTRDHLDYHGDMQTYAAVKKRFSAEFW